MRLLREGDGQIFVEMAAMLCIIKPSALSGRRIIRQYLKYQEARIKEGREWLSPSRFFASYPAVIDFFASRTSSAA